MKFTDIFIRRPVLATVVSLLILVIGLRSMNLLGVREYPETQNAVVTVSTTYFGADPGLVAGFITTPLENAISQAEGIDYLTSKSTLGVSSIQANLILNYDSSKALTEITTKVNSVINQLPQDTQLPVINVTIGETIDSMYIGFYSKELPANKVTDYLIRVVQPKLQAIEGVQNAEILGSRQFAMRAWLEPEKMAAFGVTGTDVSDALARNDFISAVGSTKGQMVTVNLIADTTLHTVDEFKELVVKSHNGATVRLKDVAKVTLGSENEDIAVSFDNENAVYIGIKVAPTANLLSVIEDVRTVFPEIERQLPKGLEGKIVYDATKFVNSSINEVIKTLAEALVIVTIVIFLFLGSFRSVVIPTIAMPLSLIGSFFLMLALGYTINLLTLLALVLAIGLVVDDAIIVVENVHRHIENGIPPFKAALQGARELAMPIIATTVVLIAVYVPIGFMGGLTGALFTEFAFTLAGAVTVSAVVALTLSPMMCSRFLKPHNNSARNSFVRFIDGQFAIIRRVYDRLLHGSLNTMAVTVVFAVIIPVSIYFLYALSKKELAPQEDKGIVISLLTTAPNATLEQTRLFSQELYHTFASYEETEHIFQLDGINGINSSIAGMVMKPWDERTRTSVDLNPEIQMKLAGIAGGQAVSFLPSPLPGGGGGLPVQFVIGTTEPFERLDEVARDFMGKAQATGMFAYMDNNLKIDKPQTTLEFDRDKAAQLGLTMGDIGSSLGWMLGGGYVNYFSISGRSYKVIPQTMQRERLNAEQLLDYKIRTAGGQMIPVATFTTLKTQAAPQSLDHFQQLNAATISAVTVPGVTLGQALDSLKKLAEENLPQGYSADYAGQSRQYMQESTALVVTFFFALIIIFLALAAQFESFRDPLIVMVSVPLSICGAMIFISLGVGGASLNIYTQVGLVTLIGLISKNGILIVQFANDLQREGKSKREAVEMAAGIRLRPILMTTAATVLGVLPLVLATGAGAAGRYNMGLVISTGISIGTFFTLFVVPAIYMLIATDHAGQQARLDEGLETDGEMLQAEQA